MKDTKFVHCQMIGGNRDDIKALSIALKDLKERMEMKIEFLVTNDMVELMSLKQLIVELYKQEKKIKEAIQK